jgi:hypothetical protein
MKRLLAIVVVGVGLSVNLSAAPTTNITQIYWQAVRCDTMADLGGHRDIEPTDLFDTTYLNGTNVPMVWAYYSNTYVYGDPVPTPAASDFTNAVVAAQQSNCLAYTNHYWFRGLVKAIFNTASNYWSQATNVPYSTFMSDVLTQMTNEATTIQRVKQ